MGRMFSFITNTWNPLAGGPCPGECSYCWATDLKNRHKWSKYLGSWRVDEKVIGKTFKLGAFIFVQDMSDLWIPDVPEDVVYKVLQNIRYQPEATFLLLTKFPEGYQEYFKLIPENCILGTTIETNLKIPISKAPDPINRLIIMENISDYFPNKTFISVEPIMEFTMDTMVRSILRIKPWAVAIGYDNYHNYLPEPRLEKTRALIDCLRSYGITVYEKTLREPIIRVGMEDRGEKP